MFGEGLSAPYIGWSASHAALTNIIHLSNDEESTFCQSNCPLPNTPTCGLPITTTEVTNIDRISLLEQQAVEIVQICTIILIKILNSQ